jgi:hypothetical protein
MNNSVNLETCRACGPKISYSLPDGGTVTIILGVPPNTTKYKAISHIWGNVVEISMVCNHCAAASLVRPKSTNTFRHILALAGADGSIWLDNISIDQDDSHNIATQVAVMGDIYSRAECVSVLLPDTDQAAYVTLAKILEVAKTIVSEKWKFEYISEQRNYELKDGDGKWQSAPSEEAIQETSTIAKGFF